MYTAKPDTSEFSLSELISMKGRVAFVTGAAQGIGLACAKRLAEAGAALFIGDINVVGAEQWTCNGFAPVTYLIMPPLLRTPAG